MIYLKKTSLVLFEIQLSEFVEVYNVGIISVQVSEGACAFLEWERLYRITGVNTFVEGHHYTPPKMIPGIVALMLHLL